MKHAARWMFVIAVLVCCMIPSVSAASTLPDSSTVVVVLAPYLSWSDVESATAPAIAALARSGAVASASIQAGSLDVSPSSLRGAAILSAGEPVSLPVDTAELEALSAPVGTLGQAIRASGGFTAAIGTSLTSFTALENLSDTPALVVAGDECACVDFAATGRGLLREDPSAPGGVTVNTEALVAACDRALELPAGKRLIVVDAGELDRARATAQNASQWEKTRAAAVERTDAVVAALMESLPADAIVMVVSTAQYEPDGTPGLAPVIIYGAGSGLLSSAGTQTEGLVTLPDVTATIAAILDVELPRATTGQPLSITSSGHTANERITALERENETARSLEALRLPSWIMLAVLALAALCAGLWCLYALARRLDSASGREFQPGQATQEELSRDAAPPVERPRGALLAASRLSLDALAALSALPLGLLLVRAIASPVTVSGAWIRLVGWCVLVMAVAVGVAHAHGAPTAIGLMAWANMLLIVVDQLLGAPLAPGSSLSYSVIFGTRFYGLGNEGAGIMIGTMLVGVGWLIDRGKSSPRMFLFAGVAAVLIAVLPLFGANVGVAAWGLAGCVAAYLYASRRKVTWRVVAVCMLGVLAILAAASLLDAILPSTSHFGRMLESLGTNGGSVAAILERKMELWVATFFASPAMVMVPIGIFLVIWVLVRPPAIFAKSIKVAQGSAAGLCGAVTAAIVGLVTEDSGAMVAALVLFVPIVALVALTLDQSVKAAACMETSVANGSEEV